MERGEPQHQRAGSDPHPNQQTPPKRSGGIFVLVIFLGLICLALGFCLFILWLIGWRVLFSLFLVLTLIFCRKIMPSPLMLFSIFFVIWLQLYFYFSDWEFTSFFCGITFVGGAIINWKLLVVTLEVLEIIGFVGVIATGTRLLAICRIGPKKIAQHVQGG